MRTITLLAAAILAVILAASQANALQCGLRPAVLIALAHNAQVLHEHGVDGKSGVYVGVTVDPSTSKWTFVMSPAGQPQMLCIVGNGHTWAQSKANSTGILHDRSVISISFDEAGDWVLIFMRAGMAAAPQKSIGGHGWERVGSGA